jgi:hypothetical protein
MSFVKRAALAAGAAALVASSADAHSLMTRIIEYDADASRRSSARSRSRARFGSSAASVSRVLGTRRRRFGRLESGPSQTQVDDRVAEPMRTVPSVAAGNVNAFPTVMPHDRRLASTGMHCSGRKTGAQRMGYFCPTPRKGKIWQKLGCDARPSEDQTPEAAVFGAKTHLVSIVPAL